MIENLFEIITQWQNQILRTGGIHREYEDNLLSSIGSRPIKIITGFRRSGKSFLLLRTLHKLVETKRYAIDNILYLNFEDFRLVSVNNPDKLNEVYMFFREEIATENKILLVLDEIQHVNAWDRFVRTVYERDSNTEIILTGSNSQLLSSEIGSRLSGRYIDFFIMPFDLKEMLTHEAIEFSTPRAFYRNKEQIKKTFAQYKTYGGLPEILTITPGPSRFSYIEGILNKVILDDIIERFNVRHPALIEKILFYLLEASGNRISYKRIFNYLKQLGINIKQETIINYIGYIVKTFAMFEINRFDWKLGKIFSTSRKFYCIDPGLLNLIPSTTPNHSRHLENIVFLKLIRNFPKIYFGAPSPNTEIDFIAQDRQKKFYKFQVTETLHSENIKRELAPFSLAAPHVQGPNFLLTLDDISKEETEFQGARIIKQNIIKWLLDI